MKMSEDAKVFLTGQSSSPLAEISLETICEKVFVAASLFPFQDSPSKSVRDSRKIRFKDPDSKYQVKSIILCSILLHSVLFYSVPFHAILPYIILIILFYYVISYHIISYHIISYCIISSHIKSFI